MKKLAIAISLAVGLNQAVFAENSLQLFREGNYQAAQKGLESLAKKDNKQALFYYGLLKLHGYSVSKNTNQAIHYIKRAAKRGNLPAQLFLAKYYFNVKSNANAAFTWFLKAANQGSISSQIFVISAYKHGFGTKKNPNKARKYIIKAAKKGNAFAQYLLGKHFLGKRHYRSRKLGISWLKKAAKKGYAPACYQLLDAYSHSYAKRHYWLDILKQQNTPQAQYYIGKYYLSFSNRDISLQGLRWLQQASQQGYLPATYTLGILYQSGDLNIYDDKKSFEKIYQAAKENYKPAQKQLYHMYKEGIGVEKNTQKAKYWLDKLNAKNYAKQKQDLLNWIEQYNPNKKLTVAFEYKGILQNWHNKQHLQKGVINQSPKMVKLDKSQVFQSKLNLALPTAVKTFMLTETVKPLSPASKIEADFPAYRVENKNPTEKEVKKIYSNALLGERNAQFTLGQFHEYGIGVDKDLNAAAQWYFTAAKQNHLPSEYHLGLLFLKGQGVKQNLKKAKYWLNRTAFKGNVEAQYSLGLIYKKGYKSKDGTQQIAKDLEQSTHMFHLASGAGSQTAKFNLAKLYSQTPLKQYASNYHREKHHQLVRDLYEQAYQSGIKEAELPLAHYYVSDKTPTDKQQWAFEILNQVKYKEDPQIALLLALMHERGIGTNKNIKRAIDYYQYAAKNNIAAAQFALGSYLYQGKHLEKNEVKAKKMLESASLNNMPAADYNLAVIQNDNKQPYQNYLNKAADAGYDKAKLFLADSKILNAHSDVDLKQATTLYHQLAQKGHEQAEFKLGYLYQHGLYLNKNLKKAYNYYLKSAQKDNPKAQFQLGLMHQLGLAANKDKAYKWYQKSATNNFVPSMVGLGFLYETKNNNFSQAKQWYATAANSPIAQYNLALALDYGKGALPEKSQALQLYNQAAQAGVTDAKYSLANHYLSNTSDNKNLKLAFDLYQQASKANHPLAHYQLAKMYETGLGHDINIAKAISHYQTAAKLGHQPSYISLARLQHTNANNSDDRVIFAHYQQASRLDNPFAKYQLAHLLLHGKGTKKSHSKAIALLNKLAAQNYAPAKVTLKNIDAVKTAQQARKKEQQALQKQAKKEGREAQPLPKLEIDLIQPKNIVQIKQRAIEEYSIPGLMYLQALNELEQGDIYQSKAMLNKIINKFPTYQPAHNTFQKIEAQEQELKNI